MLTLGQVPLEPSRRLTRLFLPDEKGNRPAHPKFPGPCDEEEPVLFHEYYHAETGQGLGASHQTGWTSFIVRCLEDVARTSK
jgi:hypothetical protein